MNDLSIVWEGDGPNSEGTTIDSALLMILHIYNAVGLLLSITKVGRILVDFEPEISSICLIEKSR